VILKFILYSATNEETVSGSLGQPEYSYYFVYKGYKRLLEQLGEVVTVNDPVNDVDKIYNDCERVGEACVFVLLHLISCRAILYAQWSRCLLGSLIVCPLQNLVWLVTKIGLLLWR